MNEWYSEEEEPQYMCQVDERMDLSFLILRTKTMWWSADADSETHQGEHKPKIT